MFVLDVYEKLEKFAQDNNLKKQLSKSTADEILCAMKNIDSNKFDGSLNNTIDLIGRKFEESLNSKTSNFADKDAKIKLLANEIKDILKTNMGFTLADLNNPSFETGSLKTLKNGLKMYLILRLMKNLFQIFNKLQKYDQ